MVNCYAERTQSGFHNNLLANIRKCDPSVTPALGAMSYAETIHPHLVSAPRIAHVSGSQSVKLGQQTYYVEGEDPANQALLCFFGQIGSAHMGTSNNAIGNFQVSNYNEAIRDGTTVKDIFCLQAVSDSPPELQQAFDNQLAILMEMIEGDSASPLDGFLHTEVTHPVAPFSSGTTLEILKFTTGLKYVIPQQSRQEDKPVAPKKTNLSIIDKGKSVPKPATKSLGKVVASGGAPSAYPAVVGVGDHYHPSVLEDYKGSVFEHQRSRLVQQPFYDHNNSAIPPWEVKTSLQRGTVVIIDAYLCCWLIPRDDHTCPKTYQLQIEKLRVLSPSDDKVDHPPSFHEGGRKNRAPQVSRLLTSRKRPSDAFDFFDSKYKKGQVSDDQSLASSPLSLSTASTQGPKVTAEGSSHATRSRTAVGNGSEVMETDDA